MRWRGGETQNNGNPNHTAIETCRLALLRLFVSKMQYFRARKEEVHEYITKLFVRNPSTSNLFKIKFMAILGNRVL
jgi:hypothetical protein